MRGAAVAALALVLVASCGSGPPEPVAIDTRNDTCSWCRMAISDRRFAAQIVAPAEEPKLFDDLGCLRDWLRGGAKVPEGAVAFVADHRTSGWVPATRAVYATVPGLATPMASGLAAWESEASRESDPDSAGGEPRSAVALFGTSLPGGGTL